MKTLRLRVEHLAEQLRHSRPATTPDLAAAMAALHEALGGEFATAAAMVERVRTGNITEADRIALDLIRQDASIEAMFGTAEAFLRTVADVDKRA